MSQQQQYPSLLQCGIVATAFKVLLFPAYKSTDFEVHRNWLALTHSLPIKEWYYEETSEWTLDYPPCFAYFEWVLSQAARFADPMMLQVKNLGYDSWQTVNFQRSSVIASELVLLFALQKVIDRTSNKALAHAASLAIFLSPGLLIIDHIHFQYNGAMYGILILSLTYATTPSTLLRSGLLFAVLLCFKHIYLYLAPAYFVYLLRGYCLAPGSLGRIQLGNCIKLGVGLVTIFAVAFGPFALWGQMDQLMSRLFPFSRGLCHAYWAPNVWALYSFTDRILIPLAPRLGLPLNTSATASVTRGLVGDTAFAVLPAITPRMTFILTILSQLPPLLKLFIDPHPRNFLPALLLTAYSSFLFGWHVHEKAILLCLLPATMLCLRNKRYLAAFRPLAVAGHASLFPLLFTAKEAPIKMAYTALWLMLFFVAFDRLAPAPAARASARFYLFDRFETLYSIAVAIVVVYGAVGHEVIFGSERMEFVPLMGISVVCAVGVVGSWLGFMGVFLAEGRQSRSIA